MGIVTSSRAARRATTALGAAALVATTLVAAGPAPESRAASAPHSCVSWTRGDSARDASLDVVAYGLDHDCATDRWHAWFNLGTTFAPSRLKAFKLQIDTDLKSSTGCGGADWELRITYSPSSFGATQGLAAQAGRYTSTSCSSFTPEPNAMAYVSEVTSRGAGISALGGTLVYDTTKGFRWWGTVTDQATGQTDRLPDRAMRVSYVPTGSDVFFDRSVSSVSSAYANAYGGDFDGDGRGDIFLYAPGAPLDLVGYATNSGAPFSWKVANVAGTYQVVVGDFNGDDRDDLLFYRPGSVSTMWYGRANRTFLARHIVVPGSPARLIACDFDDDQKTDLLLYRPGGTSVLFMSTGSGFTHTAIRLTAKLTNIAAGDFDGDGRCDLLLYRAGTGADYVWKQYNNGKFVSAPISINGSYQRLVVGDFNGDQRSDVLLYGYGTAPDVLLRGTGPSPSLTGGWRVSINEQYRAITAGRYDNNVTDDLFMYGSGARPERWWVSQL